MSRAEEIIQNNLLRFKCPVCGGIMAMQHHNNLICNNSHCFDLSKTGYLNLLASHGNTVYSKELFESRRQVCAHEFFDPVIEEIYHTLQSYGASSNAETLAILDAGCGEGSILSRLSHRIGDSSSGCSSPIFSMEYSMFGIDIAKEGIKLAAKNNKDIVWIVADLARLPFRNACFHGILNILSPANYTEFERVLTPEGIIIKVVPEKSYLEELRRLIYKNNSYSNDKVIDYFSNKLELVSKKNIRYCFEVDENILPYLIRMTPLAWGGSAVEFSDVSITEIPSVTVDLTVMVGRKKR